jgi:hypothetical protein
MYLASRWKHLFQAARAFTGRSQCSPCFYSAKPLGCKPIGARIKMDTIFMNRCGYLDPALLWAGCKDTGHGGSLSVLDCYSVTRPKSYHLNKVKK